MSAKRTAISLLAMNLAVYGINAIYYCMIPLYLGEYFDKVSVGVLLSIGPFVTIIAPLVWGAFSDRAKYKNNVLAVIIFGAAVSFTAISLNKSFIYNIVILGIVMFFMSPFGGLIDTITLEAASRAGIRYGSLRSVGTAGYGLIAVAITLVPLGGSNIIFYIFPVMCLLGILTVKLSPGVEGHAKQKKKMNLMPMLRDKNIIRIMCVVFVMMFACTYHMNFLPEYVTEVLGQPSYYWGISVLVMVVLEIPFFLNFDKIMRKFNIKSLIIIASVLYAIRYISVGLFSDAIVILLTGLLIPSVTVVIYCATFYIDKTVPDGIKASGQGFIYAVAYGVPKILAGIVGGYLTEYFGIRISSYLIAALCFGCILFVLRMPGKMDYDEIKKASSKIE